MQYGTTSVIWIGCREVNLSSVDNGGKTSPESQPLLLNCNCSVWSLFPSCRSSLALPRLRWMGLTFRIAVLMFILSGPSSEAVELLVIFNPGAEQLEAWLSRAQ